MKHYLIERCTISTKNVESPELFTLKPLAVSKRDLINYAKSRKYILTNNEKIPKSLMFRINQICPNCYFYQCTCKKKQAKIKICKQCSFSFVDKLCFKSYIKNLSDIQFNCKKCSQKVEKIVFNFNKTREVKENIIQYANTHLKHIDNFKYSLCLT